MADIPLPKAILFDLDDTILAHGAAAPGLWGELCDRFAPLLNGVPAAELLAAVEEARKWYWGDPERHRMKRLNLFAARRELVALAFSKLGIDNTEVATRLADTFSRDREEAAYLFPGAVDTLRYCRKKGLKLALVTNGASDMQRAKIERFGLEPFFEQITIEGEFGAGKPEDSVFYHTLGKLGVNAADAWMVGDNLVWDISGGRKVGLYSIWVDWRGNGLPEDSEIVPDRIVNSITELM